MKNLTAELAELIDELHDLNEDLADAARPLQWLPELDLEGRQHVVDRMRADLTHWEALAQTIKGILRDSPQHTCHDDASIDARRHARAPRQRTDPLLSPCDT